MAVSSAGLCPQKVKSKVDCTSIEIKIIHQIYHALTKEGVTFVRPESTADFDTKFLVYFIMYCLI